MFDIPSFPQLPADETVFLKAAKSVGLAVESRDVVFTGQNLVCQPPTKHVSTRDAVYAGMDRMNISNRNCPGDAITLVIGDDADKRIDVRSFIKRYGVEICVGMPPWSAPLL